MAVMDERAAAIGQTIARVRAIVVRRGAGRAALEGVKQALIALASRGELFPAPHFPVAAGKLAGLYHLAEDPDGGFALYGSAGVPGKAQPPHNHTTWAVIAGVYGDEHNVFYQRTDDGSVPGSGALGKTHELTVRRGNACALLPEDFHTIAVTGTHPSLHLHLYGHTLEDLPGRIGFEGSAGGSYRVFMEKPPVLSPLVSAAELRAMLADGGELALIDVREEGVFAKGHLLTASSAPLSRLEALIEALAPRRATRLVLCDDNEGLAQRAAGLLRRFGWRNLAVLAGGVGAWRAQGYELFSGVYVPSKAFGEHVEHACGTPRISAAELKAKLDAGEDVVVLDSRPLSEYRVMNIPGALDCPGVELAYRVHEVVARPETLVVVNCAGRTRSIIGAQSLINAGLPNKVVALQNGTMGWHLAGFGLEHGQTRQAPAPGTAALARARAAAMQVAQRYGVRALDAEGLERLRADATRTTFCFDVRSPEEYATAHLPGFASAPGGQLVQATDVYCAVRNARIVLADCDGVRARMTASWLTQMGWPEVYALEASEAAMTERGAPAPQVLGLEEATAERVDARTLERLLVAGAATVVDLASSLEYRDGHIPGAWFAVRASLADALAKIGPAQRLVFTSPDGALARLAAADARELTRIASSALEGGTRAWREAGLALEAGAQRMAAESDDVYYRPYDRQAQIQQAMQDYLTWEVALADQLKREDYLHFIRAA
ncbi:MAG TPA: rhodanese-like domain-containing protein [Burkholderiales bacterium]|nr:rhodanese-like domain-containing protein [Burkholderiales bacterium]